MILPGKITICRLEEDNPSKSFFRIRPLLINGESGFEKAEGALEQFADEGGIRIVPDRNEVARFKTRMRTLGGYCLLDLIKHTGENDKIRPNKNYSPERGELNRNIVYSDVITACPEYSVMEVITPEKNEQGLWCAPEGTVPGTAHVLLEIGGLISGPFTAEKKEDDTPVIFSEDPSHMPGAVSEDVLCTVDIGNGTTRRIFISSSIIPAPVQEEPKTEPVTAPAQETAEAPKPETEPAKPAEVPQPPKTEPAKPQSKPAEPEHKPAPAAPRAESERPPRQMPAREFNRVPMPARPAPGAPLNPRKGMSMAEWVDDSWKKARFEQLGAGVSPDSSSAPVLSPVEKTAGAVRDIIRVPEGKEALIRELGGIDGITRLFGASPANAQARDTHMDALEAERLKLLCEIDALKKNQTETRAKLFEEIKEIQSAELKRMQAESDRLKDECEARRREADSARHLQLEAAKLLDSGARAKLDNDFLRFAMFTKAARLLQDTDADLNDYAGIPDTCAPDAAQMVNELRARFDEAGRRLSNDEAVNLLVSAAVGSIVIFSGETGSGKTSLADGFVSAMGLNTCGCRRYVRLDSSEKDAAKNPEYRAMNRYSDMSTQRFVLIDDANAVPCADQTRGLMGKADKNTDPAFTLLMTVQDDQVGYPVDSRLLDRAFMIRVKPAARDTWKRAPGLPSSMRAPSLESVKQAFMSADDVPAEVVARMKIFVSRLEAMGVRLSARTMSDMFAYCAAACPLMSSPMHALDLAIAQRALPFLCATAKLPVLRKLPELLCDMPECTAVMNAPLPVMPV